MLDSMWISNADDLRVGDAITRQYGSDRAPITSIEKVDEDRRRLTFADGETRIVRVSGGRIRIRREGEA